MAYMNPKFLAQSCCHIANVAACDASPQIIEVVPTFWMKAGILILETTFHLQEYLG